MDKSLKKVLDKIIKAHDMADNSPHVTGFYHKEIASRHISKLHTHVLDNVCEGVERSKFLEEILLAKLQRGLIKYENSEDQQKVR